MPSEGCEPFVFPESSVPRVGERINSYLVVI